MKAIIEIDFKLINRLKVDKKRLLEIPQIKDSAHFMVKKLIKTMEKFLKDNRIITKITYKMEFDDEIEGEK